MPVCRVLYKDGRYYPTILPSELNKNHNIITKIYDFYNHVKHNTDNCSWTNVYPDVQTIEMDLFYFNRIPYVFMNDDGDVVGTVMVTCDGSPMTEIWLNRVAVHPRMQRTGFSKLMLEAVLGDIKNHNMCSKISLSVWECNIAAQKLYESLGFIKTEEIEEVICKKFYVFLCL